MRFKNRIFFLSALCISFFIFTNCRRTEESVDIDIDSLYLPDLNKLYTYYDLIETPYQYRVFAGKLVRANRDLNSSEMYVEAAALYHHAGVKDSAIIILHKAIDHGLANPKIISKLFGNETPYNTDSWERLQKRLDSIQLKLQKVSNYDLETEAMSEFWGYLKRALKDTSNAKRIFKEYIFEGPKALRDFYVVRYLSLENMYGQMVNGSPDYYKYLEKQFNVDSVNAMRSTTTKWMKKFKALYPEAVFPKVYVVPGILNSGGTATELGLFVGGDMYGKSANMPVRGLTTWQKNAIMNLSELPGLTIHELMHFQQNYQDFEYGDTVLAQIIGEGVCDFMVELCSEIPLENSNLSYLEMPENQARIFTDLKADLFSEDNSNWLYNGGSIEDRPHDLGYTVGYLISKSYYENSENKQKAIYELLNSSDFISILKNSSYSFLLEESI
ncbi:DUF2268 domain-containing putative Zn-dependent protease [Eudoraea chungangensis]|uniref:gliding motility protein GldB-related protein n=1 Tax=Eudoraea chungangensis TaxID=1481905 RepID=UPI0023EC2877|nr:DUF2268 domain-containing putative Zn-dependent protease [Eudoraea chungangensis]